MKKLFSEVLKNLVLLWLGIGQEISCGIANVESVSHRFYFTLFCENQRVGIFIWWILYLFLFVTRSFINYFYSLSAGKWFFCSQYELITLITIWDGLSRFRGLQKHTDTNSLFCVSAYMLLQNKVKYLMEVKKRFNTCCLIPSIVGVPSRMCFWIQYCTVV